MWVPSKESLASYLCGIIRKEGQLCGSQIRKEAYRLSQDIYGWTWPTQIQKQQWWPSLVRKFTTPYKKGWPSLILSQLRKWVLERSRSKNKNLKREFMKRGSSKEDHIIVFLETQKFITFYLLRSIEVGMWFVATW